MKNPQDLHCLESVIEKTRSRLHQIYTGTGEEPPTNETIQLSQSLDELILAYMKQAQI